MWLHDAASSLHPACSQNSKARPKELSQAGAGRSVTLVCFDLALWLLLLTSVLFSQGGYISSNAGSYAAEAGQQ